MSMSDTNWQVWQPESLLEEIEPLISVPASAARENPLTDEHIQAELVGLRQQAEQEGYAAGERRGREEGQSQGYQAGFSQGREAGLAQGEAESSAARQALVSRLTQLVEGVETSLDSLDSVIPARLVQFALNALHSMLGQPVTGDPARLLEKIQQLMQDNPRVINNIELWVSEADFPLMKTELGEVLEARRWTLRAAGNMVPGDCRITAEEGELDATLAANWQRLCDLSQHEYRS